VRAHRKQRDDERLSRSSQAPEETRPPTRARRG
jgi:hypothetical protein